MAVTSPRGWLLNPWGMWIVGIGNVATVLRIHVPNIMRWAAAVALLVGVLPTGWGRTPEAGQDIFYAIKTNLLHDVAITPDIGAEIWFDGGRVSVAAETVWAWWSNDARHQYWRVRGGWLEVRRWLGKDGVVARGHHVGIYGMMIDFDFEFGGRGVRSPGGMWGAGFSYGYSLPVSPRLHLDFNLRVGYDRGDVMKYKPMCGTYVCTGRDDRFYFGPTAVEVTLVWFPGRGKKNKPTPCEF